MNFLKSVAEYYLTLLPLSEWQNLTFVFPNRRSGVFFSKAVTELLAEAARAGKPHIVFGLNITTMGDFVAQNSGLRVTDQVTLRCELYDAYKRVNKDVEHLLRFENFYSWGSAILNDFNDIDRSLANVYAVYRNVTEWQQNSDDMSYISDRQRKAIESFWNIEFEDHETPMGDKVKIHRRFVESYTKMLDLYEQFNNQLRAKCLAYPGMLYRDAVEGRNGVESVDERKRYAFIGFSLICRAEQQLMGRLKKSGRADFFWDYSEEMAIDSADIHSAGYAVAQWIKEFPSPEGYKPPQGVPEAEQTIKIIETSYPQSQTAVVAHELQTFTADAKEGEANAYCQRSVIILPDEQMLIPLLSVIPTNIVKSLNVTMGYSLRFTNISGLAHLMAETQNTMYQRKGSDGCIRFSSRILLSLLQHPYVVEIDGKEETRNTMRRLIKENVVYADRKELQNLPLAQLVLQAVEPNRITSYATTIFEKVLDHYARKENETLNREVLWEALKVARRMDYVFGLVSDDVSDPRLLMQMLCGMLDQQKVDFQGMPLAGLQIMGVLETRALDFDNVIVLDMTEGQWPRSQMTNTMIPMVIRKGNGMPTDDEVAGSYNYYFYRLKNRAKSMTLIHPVASDRGSNNISRYVLQMQMLEPQREKNIKRIAVHQKVNPRENENISINKRVLPKEWKKNLAISPTSLSNYIACSLKFYFSKVAKIRPEDDIVEEADDRHIGTIYHRVMELLYMADFGQNTKILTKEWIDEKKKDIELIKDLTLKAYRETLKNDGIRSEEDLNGRNIITFNVIVDLVIQTLASEIPNTEIVATEQRLRIDQALDGGEMTTLIGTVDRQHLCANADGSKTYYVADYKTGMINSMSIDTIKDLFNSEKHSDKKHIMQVLMYCYMLRRNGVSGPMTPYVLSTRNLYTEPETEKRIAQKGQRNDKKPIVYDGEFEEEFNAQLIEKINCIFDDEIPFAQTKDLNVCDLCDYKYICKREGNR